MFQDIEECVQAADWRLQPRVTLVSDSNPVLCAAIRRTPADEFTSERCPGEGWSCFANNISVLVLRGDPQLQSPIATRV
jgi:hypothetical protein